MLHPTELPTAYRLHRPANLNLPVDLEDELFDYMAPVRDKVAARKHVQGLVRQHHRQTAFAKFMSALRNGETRGSAVVVAAAIAVVTLLLVLA